MTNSSATNTTDTNPGDTNPGDTKPGEPAPSIELVNRAGLSAVALETTLLLHGVPRADALALCEELASIVSAQGARPAYVGVFQGRPTVGLNAQELSELLRTSDVLKANTANLGVLMHRKSHAATTVSTTMELASRAGVRVFATGGLGGVHRGYAQHPDISVDLAAFTRFPIAVVASGVKSILDVVATREALETLGVPVIGFRTDRFPAFYRRETDAGAACGVDARFDDAAELARFVRTELARTARGVLIVNPIPEEAELSGPDWNRWLSEASKRAEAAGVTGRGVTPFILGALHEVSDRATLRANIALIRSNCELAGRIARAMR